MALITVTQPIYREPFLAKLSRLTECPIAVGIPEEPVCDPHGHVFEKDLILKLKFDGPEGECIRCPLNRQVFKVKELRPELWIKNFIDECREVEKEYTLWKRETQNWPAEDILRVTEEKMVAMQAQIAFYSSLLKEKEKEIVQLNYEKQELQDKYQEIKRENQHLTEEVSQQRHQLEEAREKISRMEVSNAMLDQRMRMLEERNMLPPLNSALVSMVTFAAGGVITNVVLRFFKK